MTTRILLVDDSTTVLMFERIMLSGQGFELDTAANGAEALEKIAATPPDLVLLDVNLPGIDGLEICRRLKSDDHTRGIPIIMVTAMGESACIERAFAAGCDDYVTKPMDKLQLLHKVRSHLATAAEARAAPDTP